MARNVLLEFRRDTAANWTGTNPTLASGEPGFETDTGKLKIGDGSTAWASLGYIAAPSGVSPLTTKGDLYGFSSTNARIPVGSNTQVLTADSTQTLGVKWATAPGANGVAPNVWPMNPSVVYGTNATVAAPASTAIGNRVIINKSGTLDNLAVFLATGSAGHNVDVGIYDTSATTRNRLYHSGATATVSSAWLAVSGVGLSVTAGDQYDLAVVADSTSVSFIRQTAAANAMSKLPTALFPTAGGAAAFLAWEANVGGSTLPSTIAESAMVVFAASAIVGWVT